MIDFSKLVLNAAMSTFAQPIVINPINSLPNAAAYPCRGVWSLKPVEIPTEAGNYISTYHSLVGIRASEFPATPLQGDLLTTSGTTYEIIDTIIDGQGGVELWLRK